MKAFSIALLLGLIGVLQLSAQQVYTARDIHSHNDYSRPDPFYAAFRRQVGALEADVFLRNGKLLVAHDTSGLSPDRSLKALYLDPVAHEIKPGSTPLDLVIDLKEDYRFLLPVLLDELRPLSAILARTKKAGPLRIVITGNRPPPAEYSRYPEFLFFDDDLMRLHTPEQWKRVAQVSLNFENYSKWKGEGKLPKSEQTALSQVITATHQLGRRLRFWGAPDNPAAWAKLKELGADILSTDDIPGVLTFLGL